MGELDRKGNLSKELSSLQIKISVRDEMIVDFEKSSSRILKSRAEKLREENIWSYLRIIKINVKLGVKYV